MKIMKIVLVNSWNRMVETSFRNSFRATTIMFSDENDGGISFKILVCVIGWDFFKLDGNLWDSFYS